MATSVLIVDDHASFRTAARMLLELEGYDVLGEAADGEDGLRAARDLQPDLVLLDIQMPGLDGFQVAEQLSADAAGPRVVLMSSREDLGAGAADAGAVGFIPKADLTAERLAALLA
jgi:DNA-binding NarL/FixJ family response regulator